MVEAMAADSMAPRPFTYPAPGVIVTSPTIMPLTAPRNVGFFSLPRNMSQRTHTSSARHGREVGIDDRSCGVRAREVRVTAVESVPAQPDDARADRDQRQTVRHEPLPVACQARADHPGSDETAGAGSKVDDVPTGIVDCALVRPVAAAPDQHRVDGVDEGRPERDENHPHLDLDPADDTPEEQQRRDRREHELEVEQCRRGLRERQRSADRQSRLGYLRRPS